MEESAENYSLQIASERFTNLAEKGEQKSSGIFKGCLKLFLLCRAFQRDTTQVPRASHFYSWATFKTVIKCLVQRGCFDSWYTLKVLP